MTASTNPRLKDAFNAKSVKLAEATMVRLFLPGLGDFSAEALSVEGDAGHNASTLPNSSDAAQRVRKRIAALVKLNSMSERDGSTLVILEEVLNDGTEDSSSGNDDKDARGWEERHAEAPGVQDPEVTATSSGKKGSSNIRYRPHKRHPVPRISIYERGHVHEINPKALVSPEPRKVVPLQPRVVDLDGLSVSSIVFSPHFVTGASHIISAISLPSNLLSSSAYWRAGGRDANGQPWWQSQLATAEDAEDQAVPQYLRQAPPAQPNPAPSRRPSLLPACQLALIPRHALLLPSQSPLNSTRSEPPPPEPCRVVQPHSLQGSPPRAVNLCDHVQKKLQEIQLMTR